MEFGAKIWPRMAISILIVATSGAFGCESATDTQQSPTEQPIAADILLLMAQEASSSVIAYTAESEIEAIGGELPDISGTSSIDWTLPGNSRYLTHTNFLDETRFTIEELIVVRDRAFRSFVELTQPGLTAPTMYEIPRSPALSGNLLFETFKQTDAKIQGPHWREGIEVYEISGTPLLRESDLVGLQQTFAADRLVIRASDLRLIEHERTITILADSVHSHSDRVIEISAVYDYLDEPFDIRVPDSYVGLDGQDYPLPTPTPPGFVPTPAPSPTPAPNRS